jgi:hypothetical protein
LGRFSDPKLVAQYLAATDEEKIKEREVESKDVEKQLADSQEGLLKRLDDLLKRKIISEAEFDRANKMEREKVAKLEARQTELKGWLEKERDRSALAE